MGAALAAGAALTACPTAADGPPPEVAPTAVAHCVYENQFSGLEECREYPEGQWDEAAAQNDCQGQTDAVFASGGCNYETVLGACVLASSTGETYQVLFSDAVDAECGSLERGCEVFGGGAFVPDVPCGGTGGGYNTGGAGSGGVVAEPMILQCTEPVDDVPGQSEGGEVCTWRAIGGCTEEGRNFIDYSTCDAVLTQRPYYPSAPADDFRTPDDDPRLADATWLGELGWVTDQVNACGCVCCHSDALAPQGPGNWYVEAEGVWTDTMWPSGLAIAAGWIDSSLLGAYPASENNGFDRSRSGLPSTDPDRMIAFFEGELTRRGYSREDFADFTPIPEPFYRQALFEPEACENGEGVAADGTVTWSGGGARYLYVLEADAENPGAPPNLDKPAGTLWKLDVAPTSGALLPGIAYGSTPEGATQAVPGSGAPPALVDGQTYYLYAQADLLIPITRCLFTYRE